MWFFFTVSFCWWLNLKGTGALLLTLGTGFLRKTIYRGPRLYNISDVKLNSFCNIFFKNHEDSDSINKVLFLHVFHGNMSLRRSDKQQGEQTWFPVQYLQERYFKGRKYNAIQKKTREQTDSLLREEYIEVYAVLFWMGFIHFVELLCTKRRILFSRCVKIWLGLCKSLDMTSVQVASLKAVFVTEWLNCNMASVGQRHRRGHARRRPVIYLTYKLCKRQHMHWQKLTLIDGWIRHGPQLGIWSWQPYSMPRHLPFVRDADLSLRKFSRVLWDTQQNLWTHWIRLLGNEYRSVHCESGV